MDATVPVVSTCHVFAVSHLPLQCASSVATPLHRPTPTGAELCAGAQFRTGRERAVLRPPRRQTGYRTNPLPGGRNFQSTNQHNEMAGFSNYSRFARWVSQASGSGVAFCIAAALVLTWALTGKVFDFSDTWQLIMNTCSSIITLLMVFLIQNTLNRDSTALQIKLDELIRALEGAQNAMIGLEHLDDEQLARLAQKYADIADRARQESSTRSRRVG